jgi:plastocyanin
VGLSSCSTGASDRVDLVNGKRLFVQRCGACHVLDRAATRGTTGPDLDQAFVRSIQDGFGRDDIRGIVNDQILYPNINGGMPGKLVTGEDAQDVAAYVARSSALGGRDTGALATAVGGEQKPLLRAQNGVLTNPANPNGLLRYEYKNMEAPAGPLTIRSPNRSQVDHDIAINDNGVNEKGEVGKGANFVSEFEFDAQPGEYEFLCTVPGHAQAGMRGTLTVK